MKTPTALAKELPPAIVYGALRSGSTLLRLMLDGHSQLSCTGEHDFLFDYLHKDGGHWRCNLDALREDRIFRAQKLAAPDADEGANALRQLLEQISRRGGAPRTILMLHRGLDKAIELLPTAPVVHLLRDPRDVSRSWVGMGWQGNAYRASEGWIKTERLWESTTGKLEAPSMELRYEALVADPEAELDRVSSFLGTEFEGSMLTYPQNSTYSAPDARLAEQWKRKMSERDLRLVEARLGSLLTERGYEQSGYPPLAVTAAQRVILDLESAYGRWRHLIGRYGLLPVQRGIGRRFRMKAIEQSAQRKIDAITVERYLR